MKKGETNLRLQRCTAKIKINIKLEETKERITRRYTMVIIINANSHDLLHPNNFFIEDFFSSI